jgi:hypothetical protein
MPKLIQCMEYVKTYLDDLLILTNMIELLQNHLLTLNQQIAGMRVNISKSMFFEEQIEYLG